MKKRTSYAALLTAATLIIAPLTAAAWSHGKPGLWAVTSKIDLGSNAPQIPPDQLAKLQQMGIKLPNGEPITTNTCVTPEQAAQDTPKPPQRDSSCQMQNFKKDGSSFSGDMVCDGGTKGTGHFQATYVSDESYTGSMNFNGTSKHGPVTMNNTFSGKWLSADCGSVKPFESK